MSCGIKSALKLVQLTVIPEYGFSDCPSIDILAVPGGYGTRALLEDMETFDWIDKVCKECKHVTSVCTGTLLLAKLGVLGNPKATTHWSSYALLESIDFTISVQQGKRIVLAEKGMYTSERVSAGTKFNFVECLCGDEVANETAHYMEYPRKAEQTSQ